MSIDLFERVTETFRLVRVHVEEVSCGLEILFWHFLTRIVVWRQFWRFLCSKFDDDFLSSRISGHGICFWDQFAKGIVLIWIFSTLFPVLSLQLLDKLLSLWIFPRTAIGLSQLTLIYWVHISHRCNLLRHRSFHLRNLVSIHQR